MDLTSMEDDISQRDLNTSNNTSHVHAQDRHPLQGKSPTNKSPINSPQKKLSMFRSTAGDKIPPPIDPIQPNKKPSLDDYICICSLGRGTYGEVILCKDKQTSQDVAIKVIDKRFMSREQKQYQVFIEKEMLQYLKHVGVIQLYSTFQTAENLYFVIEYVEGGSLAEFLRLNRKNLTYEDIRFYMAEIVVIMEYLHSKGIAHRDLKPENLLITNERHIKIIDFGTCSIYDESLLKKQFVEKINDIRSKYKPSNPKQDLVNRKQRATFVGTAEYVSPELLEDELCDNASDIWALGCILYKFFVGTTPFYENSEYLVFENIKNCRYKIPDYVPEAAASLINKWLQKDPKKRIGSGPIGTQNDFRAVKEHEFFRGIDFERIFEMKAPVFQSFKVVRYDTLQAQVQPKDEEPYEQEIKSKVLFNGLVLMKIGWFIYRPVELILFQQNKSLKLIFYDPQIQKKKNKITIYDGVKFYLQQGVLVVEIEMKPRYKFHEIEHPLTMWLEVIEKSRKQLK